ncbi:MAG: family 10 glycosylhydrolase [Ignavibacteriales bacterium]|nr:family 10 glycosylhydrolase [Ignavibacteriales bacterium]
MTSRKLLPISVVIAVVWCIFQTVMYAQEVRGAWVSRNELSTRTQIAYVMDSLANNNFNVVYVNAWSRGYPLFRSEVYRSQTGLLIDPTYAERDVLAEAIIEGHRRGLEVEAWFEYGFVGGYTGWLPGTSGKGKIFDVHPDWVARKADGTEKDASNFYWMTHTRPEVQQFLIGLCKDVAQNYDIDGIELDRVRYAGTMYGYDTYTDSVYRATHAGAAPPATTTDAGWMRWRADILNSFMRAAYDTIKAVNKNVRLTNAPSSYGSSTYQAYNENLQDWWQWVRTGSVDQVQVQMYASDNYTLTSYLDFILMNLTEKNKIVAGLAIAPSGTALPFSTLSQMMSTCKSKGLPGVAWWYYGDFTAPVWDYFRTQFYPTRVEVPGRPAGWRAPGLIVNETDSTAVKSTGWSEMSLAGYRGKILRADSVGVKTIDYSFDVPALAWYDVYAHVSAYPLFTARAPYDLFDSAGTATRILVDQSATKNQGWCTLGEIYLPAGKHTVVRISNENIGYQKNVSADAVMLTINRRKSPNVVVTGAANQNFSASRPDKYWLGQNYPNPFNPETSIQFGVPNESRVSLTVCDVLGRTVATLADRYYAAGIHTVRWNAAAASSGVYLLRLQAYSREGRESAGSAVKKLLLLR